MNHFSILKMFETMKLSQEKKEVLSQSHQVCFETAHFLLGVPKNT